MANTPLGQGLVSGITATSSAIAGVQTAVGTAGRLAGAISSFDPNNIVSSIRSINLPAAGEAIGDIVGAIGSFSGGSANENDWRVRLNMASWVAFGNSPVLKPLVDAGGLIFPYTPTITINQSAKYDSLPVTQTNYTFPAFKNSDPGTIQITAPMNVEDKTQALYWIAALHYCRSLTKMFSGSDPKAGNPPPIVYLNGYGNYVFKNIPCVVTNFQSTLENGCDYISVDVVGSAAGAIEGITDSLGGLADTVGATIPGLSDVTSSLSSVLGVASGLAGLAGTFGIGGTTSGGQAHVPTKSTFTVTLQPIYSRASARNFSLDRFVSGGYLNNTFGYI